MTDKHTKTRNSLPTIRLEHLWVLLALCIAGMFISMVPTTPNDFWWHLKAGQLVAEGGIPTTNLFAWTIPADQPFVYQSWLGEWLFYMLYRAGGLPFVVFVRNMLALTAFTLVAFEAWWRSGSWRLSAGVVVLAVAMSLNNLTTRTQNWSWVPFMLVVVLLGRYTEGRLRPRWLVALPVLMVFWVNVHGAFVLGLVVAGAFVVGETLRRLLRQPRALKWQRLRLLYAAFVAMLAATMVNPLGPGVFGYVRSLLQNAPIQSLISEWQAPAPGSLAGTSFYLGVLAVIAAFAFARRRPTITDVLLVCGLAWQAFGGIRHVLWFGMVAMPIVAQSLARPRAVLSEGGATTGKKRPSHRERGGGDVPNLVVAGMLVLVVVAFQPWFKPLLPLPQPYQELFAPVPGAPLLFSSDTPVGAAEHLLADPCDGHIFNEMGYGSYFAWATYPETRVFLDTRIELYPMELWNDYVDLTKGYHVEQRLDQTYNEQEIACVVLDKGFQPRLSQALTTMPGWERTYADRRSEVWRRQ